MNKGLVAAVVGIGALAVVAAVAVMSQPTDRPKAESAEKGAKGKGKGKAKGKSKVAAAQPALEHPNVIIILWDTVRADRMSLYGYELDTTPRIKKWAEENGMVFDHAVSPAMWTVPSHASMFSGTPPSTHGAGFDHRWLDDKNLTLAEHFRDNGYYTYAFSANPNLSPNRVNLLQGFDHKDLSWARKWKKAVTQHTRQKLIKTDASTEISPANPGKHKGVGFYNAGPVTHQALTAWLDNPKRDASKPFFAYLSYMEAHKPRVPKLENRKVVADDDTIRLGLATDLTFQSQLLYSYEKKAYTPEELEAVNRVYDASLRDLDDATADLLDDLAQRGILDDTIVVLTADHGEQLGEHQQFGHRNGVYQALLHVPLVIAYPKKLKPQRVTEFVTNLQIYDTLVELAGLPDPQGAQQIVPGNLTRPAAKLPIFAESISIDRLGFGKVKKAFPDLTRDVWANKYRTVSLDQWKLIETIDFDTNAIIDHELYHLAEDPHETTDLAEAEPERAMVLKDRLHAWHDAIPKWDAATADEVKNIEDQGDADAMKEQLEMLGYVADDEEEEDAPPKPE